MQGDICIKCRKIIDFENKACLTQWTINGKIYSWCEDCWKEYQNETERKKKEKELLEKIEQYKHDVSHCHYCNNKSNIYHYIYDTKNNTFTQTTQNATNLAHQKVFCNKTCFKQWVSQEAKKKDSSQNNRLKRLLEEQAELAAERDELLRELENNQSSGSTCSECNSSIASGTNYFYNSAQPDGKKFCSSTCFNNHYNQKCDKCSKQIGESEKSYFSNADTQTGTLCYDCKVKQLQSESSSVPKPEESAKNNPAPSTSNAPSTPSSPSSPTSPSNTPPPTQATSSSTEKCCNCKKTIQAGEEYHYVPQDPKQQKWCLVCHEEVWTCIQTSQEILKGNSPNIDSLKISEKNKKTLKLFQRIKYGEQINVDSEQLEEEDKQQLKELQQMIKNKQIPLSIKPFDKFKPLFADHKFRSICSKCGADYSHKDKKPSKCLTCGSKDIKIYNQLGQEETVPKKTIFSNPYFWGLSITGLVGLFLLLYQIRRYKKAKKQGKKYNWWKDKIEKK